MMLASCQAIRPGMRFRTADSTLGTNDVVYTVTAANGRVFYSFRQPNWPIGMVQTGSVSRAVFRRSTKPL